MENQVVGINVSLQHAVLMLNILNVVSARGAIRPDEMKPVGDLFEFLQKELKPYIKETPAQEEAKPEEK